MSSTLHKKYISSWQAWYIVLLHGKNYSLQAVVILFPTEYKWKTEYMSNIITTRKPYEETIDIDDSIGGHQRSQRFIRLATKEAHQAGNQSSRDPEVLL